MSSFISDPTSMRIMTEGDLINIISNFDLETIYDIVENNINYRFVTIGQLSNLVNAYEIMFKNSIADCGQGSPMIKPIMDTRTDLYNNIIDILSRKFNIQYIDNDEDKYTPAFCLYDLCISKFRDMVSSFYANYIIREHVDLYKNLGIARFKKQKDSTTAYNKIAYENQELGLLVSNLDFVLESMKSFDINIETILDYAYNNPEMKNYLLNTFIFPDNFYQNEVLSLLNSYLKAIIITDIRFKIDMVGTMKSIQDLQNLE